MGQPENAPTPKDDDDSRDGTEALKSGDKGGTDSTDPKDSDDKETRQTGMVPVGELAKLRDKFHKLQSDLDAEKRKGMTEAERVASELKDAKSENARLKTSALQLEIALERGLPLRIARRLQGESKAEMEADADEFVRDLKLDQSTPNPARERRTPPPNDSKKTGGSAGKPSMNDLLRIAAGRK